MADGPKAEKAADGASPGSPFDIGKLDASAARSTVTIGGDNPAEGVILAYRAANAVAALVAAEIEATKASTVFMLNPADVRSLSTLQTFLTQVTLLKGDMDAVLEAGRAVLRPAPPIDLPELRANLVPAAIAAAAGAVVSSFIGIASLFREDVAYTALKVSVEDRALVTAVAGALIAGKMRVRLYDTATMPLPPLDGGQASGAVLASLKQLAEARLEVVKLVGEVDVAILSETARLKATTGQTDKAEPKDEAIGSPKLRAFDDLKATAVAVLDQHKAFEAALMTPEDGAGVSRLSWLFAAERLKALVVEGTYFLSLKVLAAGGSVEATSRLIHGQAGFSGAVVVSYALHGHLGEIVRAGTIPIYSGFKTKEEVANDGPPGSTRLLGQGGVDTANGLS